MAISNVVYYLLIFHAYGEYSSEWLSPKYQGSDILMRNVTYVTYMYE